jgi:hypothetical protein
MQTEVPYTGADQFDWFDDRRIVGLTLGCPKRLGQQWSAFDALVVGLSFCANAMTGPVTKRVTAIASLRFIDDLRCDGLSHAAGIRFHAQPDGTGAGTQRRRCAGAITAGNGVIIGAKWAKEVREVYLAELMSGTRTVEGLVGCELVAAPAKRPASAVYNGGWTER